VPGGRALPVMKSLIEWSPEMEVNWALCDADGRVSETSRRESMGHLKIPAVFPTLRREIEKLSP